MNPYPDSDLDLHIERYRLSATREIMWDVEWKSGQCVHRWLVVALWKARKRHLTKIATPDGRTKTP